MGLGKDFERTGRIVGKSRTILVRLSTLLVRIRRLRCLWPRGLEGPDHVDSFPFLGVVWQNTKKPIVTSTPEDWVWRVAHPFDTSVGERTKTRPRKPGTGSSQILSVYGNPQNSFITITPPLQHAFLSGYRIPITQLREQNNEVFQSQK